MKGNSLAHSEKKFIEDYFEKNCQVNLELEQLLLIKSYRLVHAKGVKMKNELMKHGFSQQHPFIVKRYDDAEDNRASLLLWMVCTE